MPVSVNARREAFRVESGGGRPINVYDNDVTIKISSRDTGGAYTVFEAYTQPFEGPPLHRHRTQDESWYILEGIYRFVVDGEEIFAGAGDTVFAPRGSRHTFQSIGTTPGRVLTTVVPGGLDIFFEEIETAAQSGAVPNPATMAPIFEKHGMELLGPPLAEVTRPAGSDSD
jgi:mannose-6-phosphate isomerase-like protein (cupin superfamily)